MLNTEESEMYWRCLGGSIQAKRDSRAPVTGANGSAVGEAEPAADRVGALMFGDRFSVPIIL